MKKLIFLIVLVFMVVGCQTTKEYIILPQSEEKLHFDQTRFIESKGAEKFTIEKLHKAEEYYRDKVWKIDNISGGGKLKDINRTIYFTWQYGLKTNDGLTFVVYTNTFLEKRGKKVKVIPHIYNSYCSKWNQKYRGNTIVYIINDLKQ